MLIGGIDIGKFRHEACIIDETGKRLSKTLSFTNTTNGGEKLLEYFKHNNPDNRPLSKLIKIC